MIAMTTKAHARISALPHMMSDDLVISEAFDDSERKVVSEATVEIWVPRTLRDLLRRRVRVATGNAQASDAQLRGKESKTTWPDLVGIALSSPRCLLSMPVFVGVTVAARIMSRRAIKRGDFTTWLRDESSRA